MTHEQMKVGGRRQGKANAMMATLMALFGPASEKPSKPLKMCACGTGYNHRGYQCRRCHDHANTLKAREG